MGVLRYFPGSEPRDEADDAPSAPDRGEPGAASPEGAGPERRGPQRAARPTAAGQHEPRAASRASEPAWTVPGRSAAGPRAIETHDDADPGGARAAEGTDDPGATHPSRGARRAENVSLATLTTRDVSESEMRQKLVARGLPVEEVESELARLLRAGLLDDDALAARLIDRLRDRKGLGDAALRPALRARGIPAAVLDRALDSARDDEDQAAERLREVAVDRARRLGGLTPEVAERRLVAYLARKGYGGSAARRAAREALSPTADRGGDGPA